MLLREAQLAPVVELQVWARVGSADERPGEAGLAHFHEHMLFKGTERRGVGEVAGDIEGAGGRINAYTRFDITVYHATLPSDQLAVGVDVLADAVQHSDLRPGRDRARDRGGARGDPPLRGLAAPRARQRRLRARVPRAPVPRADPRHAGERARPSTARACARFFERWYAPEEPHRRGGRRLRRGAAARARCARPSPAARASRARRARASRAAAARPAQRRCCARPFERASLELAWPAVALAHPDAPLLDLLAFVLGGGESSRLVRRVKERDAARSTASTPRAARRSTRASSASASRPTPRARREALGRGGARGRDAAPRAGDGGRAREGARELPRERALRARERVGPRAEARQLPRCWPATTRRGALPRRRPPRDARRSAARGARASGARDARRSAPCCPKPSSGARATALEARRRAPARAQTRARFAPSARSAPRRGADAASCLRARERRAPHVLPRRERAGGRRCAPPSSAASSRRTRRPPASASFLASMWLRGTEQPLGRGLRARVEGLAAEIDGFSGRNSLGLTLEATRDSFAPALELFAEALLEPALRRGGDRARARRDARRDRAPRGPARRARLPALPRGALPQRTPTACRCSAAQASVAGFDRERAARAPRAARALRATSWSRVVGDVDPDDAAARARARLAELAAGDVRAAAAAPRSRRRTSRARRAAQGARAGAPRDRLPRARARTTPTATRSRC